MYKTKLADAKKKTTTTTTTQQQQQILFDERKIAIPSRRWEQIKKKCFLADLSRPKQYQTDRYIAT